MSRFVLRSAAFFLGTVACVLVSAPRPAWAIDGGLEDTDSDPQHPNACAVIGVPADPDGPLRMASGVLIHPRVVLTAGHVTDWYATIWDVPPERTRISFSANAFDESEWLEVDEYVTHPLYNGYFGPEGHADVHDLGVIILTKPVKKRIRPATLPRRGLLDDLQTSDLLQFGADHGTQLTVVGYGWGFSFPPPTPLRDERGIRRYGPTRCMGMTHASLHFSLDPDGVVTQNGVSGGPTFWEDAEGNRVLVAVTAWGSPVPGVDHRYRVDTPDSLDFIESVIAAVEAGLLGR
jgi:hypothetical protein